MTNSYKLCQHLVITQNKNKIVSISFYIKINCHLQGLKTGMYYLRTKPAANPIQFTVDKSKLQNRDSVSSASNTSISTINDTPVQSPNKDVNDDDDTEKRKQLSQQASKNLEAMLVCSRKNGDACTACSS